MLLSRKKSHTEWMTTKVFINYYEVYLFQHLLSNTLWKLLKDPFISLVFIYQLERSYQS